VNSRFVYIYPLDMLIMSLGFLSGILFFYRNRVYASVGLLTAVALSLLTKKIAIMLCPFVGVMALDTLVFRQQKNSDVMLFRAKVSYLFFCGVVMVHPFCLCSITNRRGLPLRISGFDLLRPYRREASI
jgi:hypothetical protein